MNTYSVYMPGDDTNISNAKFLVDGKSLFAVIAPPLWLIWHKMWWGLGVYFALLACLSLLAFTPMREAVIYLSAIPGFYLFLEGNELVRQQYERRGGRFIGVVQGRNIEDAEQVFFDHAGDENWRLNLTPNKSITPAENKPTSHDASPVSHPIGLFPLGS